MRGVCIFVCIACVLALGASCGKTRHDTQLVPCEIDADCVQGRCLATGVCSSSDGDGGGVEGVTVLDQSTVEKVDLLFVIDNSIAMADKQALLRQAVPQFVNRLVSPAIDSATGNPEFKPIMDMHIGIVSSSLGGHGADVCSPAFGGWKPTQDDRAHLIGSVRSVTSYQNLGFLAWDPTSLTGGEANSANLIANFQEMVTATGEEGCGFEATLEAWYRFLIDPRPPLDVVVQNGTAVPQGIDDVVLQQRAAFLRPDSLVVVSMFTDENDCSVIDGGIGWLSSQAFVGSALFHLPRATSACASDPNSPCCTSCGSTSAPASCPSLTTVQAIQADAECQKGPHDDTSDALALRCWEQKRRFGVDFLYPTQRYVDALKSRTVRNRDNVDVQNPLYGTTGGTAPRDTSLVFLAGIVGVPWQDIATPETLTDPSRLEYLRTDSVNWDWIVGDVNRYIKALDPLMHEQPDPRSGVNPAINAPLAPPTSTNPQENPINGHEYNIIERDDLQYACIFELATPRDCSTGTGACDCAAQGVAANKPLCQPPGGGAAGTTQYWAKAYPGLRHLQVLKDFGDNSIVASICPKVVSGDATTTAYGYNAAFEAIVDRLKGAFGAKCLARDLAVDDDPASATFGLLACDVIEALPPDACLPCDAQRGTSDIAPGDPLIDVARRSLAESGACGPQASCEDFCLCRINQYTGLDLAACQAGVTPQVPGFCYVDDSINPALVDGCPATQRRMLRFVGDNLPAKGAITMISCGGESP